MKKKYKICIFIIITLLGLAVRIQFLAALSGDMKDFIIPWFEEISANGGFKALGLEIGNYNIIYMTILTVLTYLPISPIISVKVISIIFDYLIAITVAKIVVYNVDNKIKKDVVFIWAYAIILFLPTIILNSSAWGQCDSIYATFILLSILFLMKEKFLKSIVLLGIAFSFKLQTIFIFPLYGLIYLGKRKFPFYYFFIIPIINVATWLPAIINGRTISSCLGIYLGQTETINNLLTRNFTNIYNFFTLSNTTFVQQPNNYIYIISIGILILIFIILSLITFLKKINIKDEKILIIGIWSIYITTFFLPYMHERYLFVGDILAVTYVLKYKKNTGIALLGVFISTYLYMIYLCNEYIFNLQPIFIAIYFTCIVIYVSVYMIKKVFIEERI